MFSTATMSVLIFAMISFGVPAGTSAPIQETASKPGTPVSEKSRDVIASVIYKQYQAGFYGLSTAGNVILFVVVTAIEMMGFGTDEAGVAAFASSPSLLGDLV